MTIEALLGEISGKLGVLVSLMSADGGADVVTSAASPGAEAPKRGRGRPARGETAGTAVQPTVNPVQTATAPVVPEVDPFDFDSPPPPPKKYDKADVRAALEAFRGRLKDGHVKNNGDNEATAQAKATQRALAWLNEVSGTTTLASLTEDKFALVIEKAATAK